MQVLNLETIQSVKGAGDCMQSRCFAGGLDKEEATALRFMDANARNSSGQASSDWNTAWRMYFIQAMQD